MKTTVPNASGAPQDPVELSFLSVPTPEGARTLIPLHQSGDAEDLEVALQAQEPLPCDEVSSEDLATFGEQELRKRPCPVPRCSNYFGLSLRDGEDALLVATLRTNDSFRKLRGYGINTDHARRIGPYIVDLLISTEVAHLLEQLWAEEGGPYAFVAIPSRAALTFLRQPLDKAEEFEAPLEDWLRPASRKEMDELAELGDLDELDELDDQDATELRVYFGADFLLPGVGEVDHA